MRYPVSYRDQGGDWYLHCKWRQIGNHFLGSVLPWFQNVCHFHTSKQNNIRIIVSYSNVFSRTLKLLVKCRFNICHISLCKGWRHFLWIFNLLLIGRKLRLFRPYQAFLAWFELHWTYNSRENWLWKKAPPQKKKSKGVNINFLTILDHFCDLSCRCSQNN